MDKTSTDDEGDTTHVERPANLERASGPQPPALVRGVIRQLKHLSAGTDISSTHLVAAHNGVGYGYIRVPEGEVFFDATAITNLRFDQLTRNHDGGIRFGPGSVLENVARHRRHRRIRFQRE